MNRLIILAFSFAAISSCKKDPVESNDNSQLSSEVLSSFSSNVAQSIYNDLATQTNSLHEKITQLKNNTNDANLSSCKQLWKDARSIWEKSEGFLFGPVSSENIDPRIDTWPVNFVDLDSVMSGNQGFSDGYIDSLEDALKGFHPIEYLLFGVNGNKVASDLTSKQLDYLFALSKNLKSLTAQLSNSWNPNQTDNYHTQFINAGNGNSLYTTKKAALEELVNSMSGICDEVANGKIGEPFTLQDPSLEESPYSSNSLIDFTNNIKGVETVYLAKYSVDGKGLEDFVRTYNLSLDAKIKQKISVAVSSLNNITLPFGQAIIQQPVQVQNAIDAINDLKSTLDTELLPLIQLNAK